MVPVPPLTLAEIEPLAVPLQLGFVEEGVDHTKALGCVIVFVAVVVQPDPLLRVTV